MTDTTLTKQTLGGLPVFQPDAQELPWTNSLFYGDPGVGKTTLAASACEVPEMSPVVLLDVEGGTLSLRRKYPKALDIVRLRSFNDFNKIAMELKKDMAYRTVIMDSVTEIQKFGMYEIIARGLVKAQEDDRLKDPDLPELQDWGKNIEQTRKLIRFFRDLPCHTIFTALAMSERVRGKDKYKPSMSGKLSNEVAGFIDIVGYMYKKDVDGEIKRLLLFSGTDDIVAKDRSDVLPPVMEDPSMSDIFRIIHTPIND